MAALASAKRYQYECTYACHSPLLLRLRRFWRQVSCILYVVVLACAFAHTTFGHFSLFICACCAFHPVFALSQPTLLSSFFVFTYVLQASFVSEKEKKDGPEKDHSKEEFLSFTQYYRAQPVKRTIKNTKVKANDEAKTTPRQQHTATTHTLPIRLLTMEVLSLRNLKVIYFSCLKSSIVIPPQCLRCIGWDLLLLAQFLIVRSELTDELIERRIGENVWRVGVAMALLSGLFSLLTVFTDPGILPPINMASLTAEEQQRITSPPQPQQYGSSTECETQSPNSLLEQHAPAVAHFDIGMQSFCRRCQHLRPPLTAHCWWSDVCISEMDHYCIILGVVIGARNLRWFLSYLFFMSLTSLMGIYVTFNSLEIVSGAGVKLFVFILIICAALMAFACTTYFFAKSVRLIWAGQSTRGEIKGLQTSVAAPKGFAAIRHVFFPLLGSLLPLYYSELAILALTDVGGSGDDTNGIGERVELNPSDATAVVTVNGVEYPTV